MADSTSRSSAGKTLAVVAVIAILGAIAYVVLTMPDQRTTGQKVGDAIDTLPEEGPGKAVEQLEDRTPGERLGDAVEDTGESIQENTDR